MASIDTAELDEEPFRWLAGIFDKAGLDAVLIGGHAVNAWTPPRVTVDWDFTVAADRAAIEKVEALLLGAGFEYLRDQDAGEASGPEFVRMAGPGGRVIVDLQVAKTEFQEQAIARGVPTGIGTLLVARPEDLILFKLIAGRSKDTKDLLALAEIEGLDWDYIERIAPEWDVMGRLEELRKLIASGSTPGL